MAKFPDNQHNNDILQKNRAEVTSLWQQCNDFLLKRPAKQEIVKQQLKMTLENHRLDMNL